MANETKAPVLAAVPYLMWRKRDGTEVRVVDMDDQHLLNSIRMMERNADRLAAAMNAEQPTAWEVGDVHEADTDDLLRCHKGYRAMVAVARARGIDLDAPCAWVDPAVGAAVRAHLKGLRETGNGVE